MLKKNLKKDDEQKFIRAIRNLHFAEYVDFIRSPWRTFLFGFLKGTGIGLGMLVGAAVIIAILTYIINLLGGLPVIGEWVEGLGRIIGAK